MSSIPSTSQRKRPRQERAKATVSAILEATSQVLVASGYARLTTTQVAKRAGVSVGTLYQYFGDKEALIRALWEQHEAEVFGVLAAAIGDSVGLRAEPRIEHVLGAVLRAKGRDARLTMALAATMHELEGPAHLARMTAQTQEAVAALLVAHSDELTVDDPELTTFVIVNAIEGVISGAIASRPDELADPALIRALTKMLYRFLREGEPVASGAERR